MGDFRTFEDRFGIAKNKPRFIVTLDGAGNRRALSDDRCIEILDEAAFLHTGGFGLVDFTQIPRGLSARKRRASCARVAPRSAVLVVKILLDQRPEAIKRVPGSQRTVRQSGTFVSPLVLARLT